jgi:hypothetical protein
MHAALIERSLGLVALTVDQSSASPTSGRRQPEVLPCCSASKGKFPALNELCKSLLSFK